jgi:hypothetical protein
MLPSRPFVAAFRAMFVVKWRSSDTREQPQRLSAKDEVEVDAIWADDLRELVSAFPGFGMRFYRSLAVILAERLRQTSKELLREMTNKR